VNDRIGWKPAKFNLGIYDNKSISIPHVLDF